MMRRLGRFDRRRLLQFGAAGAGVLAGAPLLRGGPRRVAAQGNGPLDGALDSGFTAHPSTLTFGAVADVAAGWDGTLWAVDAAGAPSVYDPMAQGWVLHGTGIDAVAYAGVPSAGAVPGAATPAAIAAGTVVPPPLAPATPATTPFATVAPPPFATVSPPPLAPESAPLEEDEGQVLRIGLAGAPAQQVAPPATPETRPATVAPAATTTPASLAPSTPAATAVVPPPLAPSTPAATAVVPPPLAPSTPAATTAVVPPPLTPATPAPSPTPGAPGTATAAASPTRTMATATATARALGDTPSGYYLFRGPDVLYLPLSTLSAVAAPGAAAPPAAVATAMATPALAAVATPPAASPPARTVPPPAPVGAAVPLTPGVPQAIAALWPDLPPAFKLGVRGAADVDGVLYLFKGGRYVRADGTAPPANLTDIPGWPQSATWKDGALDLVGSGRGDGQVLLVRGDEYLEVDFSPAIPRVSAGPAALSAAFGGAFLAALQSPGGADAVLFGEGVATAASPWVFQGAAVSGFDGAGGGSAVQWRRYVAAHFAPSWPATWNPVLTQAPSGRTGDLWAPAAPGGTILHHDGAAWTPTPGAATSVAAGADGSAWCVGVGLAQHNVYRWNPATAVWDTVLQFAPTLAQIAVGDASRVWLRGADNSVSRLQGAQLAPVPQLGTPVHIAASADGTVWSCDGSQPTAFRLVSEASAPPEAIGVGASEPVQKVACTGFGAAHCLAGQGAGAQVYRYDSPYVFKTSQVYIPDADDPIETGLGNVYLTIGVSTPTFSDKFHYVVALDAHTGQEVSRSAAAPDGLRYTGPVFDPIHEVVVVRLVKDSPSSPSTGQLLGLDARDLTRVRWTLTPQGGMATGGRPTLDGTRLCFTDDVATIAMYDTGAALDGTPVHLWSHSLPTIPSGQYRLPPPVLLGGTVYAAWWTYDTSNRQRRLYLVALSAAAGAAAGAGPAGFTAIDAATAQASFASIDNTVYGRPPLLAQVSDGDQVRTVLFVNGANVVWRVEVAAPNPALSYGLPSAGAPNVSSGFAYGAGGLWFGDDAGTLYGLDEKLQPLPHTPVPLGTGRSGAEPISTTPIVYQGAPDAQGGPAPSAVFLGVESSSRPPGLLAFDPVGGKVVAVSTGRSVLTLLSRSVTDGVLYAAGGSFPGDNTPGEAVAQVFGIRVDEAVQTLRDFVAESELLQDFDPGPGGGAAPANAQGAARYQTHLTLLDDARGPRPLTPLKIWADAPTTLQVNGAPYAVGPGDTEFAAVQAGPDGVVTIVSGAVATPGQGTAVSAGADMAAVPLRVWAGFMDPYERLVVFPDTEFHNRLATAHATAPTTPGYDDPTRINLSAVRSFGPLQSGGAPTGPSLFTDDERGQQQPQQVAQAIQTMTKATGSAPSGGATSAAIAGRVALRGRATAGAAWVRRSTDTPGAAGKYLAYDDLPGARFAPANTPSPRPAVAVQPAGLSYSRDAAGANPPALGQLAPAAAAAAIDALDGTPWEQSVHAPQSIRAAARAGAVRGVGAGLGSWWSDFWDWLKSAAARITHFIVSVAEDIYVGIRLVVDKVVYVFKQIVHALEEVAHAIGALFVELAKLIEKVVEALALLFDFGEVIKTHTIIKTELLNRINGVSGNTAYPGFAAVVTNTVRPKVDAVFGEAETGASGALNALADKLSGTAPVGGITGGGATAHSALTVGPGIGPGRASNPPKDGTASSQAVQGTWALQKLKSGVGGAGGGAGTPSGVGAAANPLTAFFDTFAASIQGNGPLTGQWQAVRDGFSALGSSHGAGDFLKRALAELLRLLALLVDGALAVANAFVDGILAEIGALMSLLFDAQSGLLTTEVEIPVLSWLYRALFGEPLTVINAISLVVALPVTLIWRVVEGKWPSQSVGGASVAAGGVGAAPSAIRSLINYANIVLTIGLGFIYAVGDIRGGELASPTLGKVALALSLFVSACNLPLVNSTSPPSDFDWIGWGLALSAAALNILGAIELTEGGPAQEVLTYLGPVLLGVLSAGQLAIFVLQFVKDPPSDPMGDAILGLSIATTVPGIVNVFKLAPPFPIPAAVVALLDVAMGLVGAVIIGLEDSQSTA